jgi:zinc D-Ala-D-Ala carboxypeptidase
MNLMQLSKNFTLKELTRSDYANRMGLDNTPSEVVIANLKNLATSIIQPIRDHFGIVIINSGYRSPQVNAAIGGSKTSDHVEGLAADLEVPGITNYSLAKWCSENLIFKQLILEFYTPGDPESGWVHISLGTKGQVLTAVKEKGSTIYKVGLVA